MLPDANFRDRVDPEVVERYREVRTALPPLKCVNIDGKIVLADGFHRLEAHKKEGADRVFVDIVPGTMREVRVIAATENCSHGHPLARDERNRAITWLAENGFPHGDIAAKFGLDQSRVSQIATAAGVRRRPAEVQQKARATRARTAKPERAASSLAGGSGTSDGASATDGPPAAAQPTEQAVTPPVKETPAPATLAVEPPTRPEPKVNNSLGIQPSAQPAEAAAPPSAAVMPPQESTTLATPPLPEVPPERAPSDEAAGRARITLQRDQELMLSLTVEEWRVLLANVMSSPGYRSHERVWDVANKLLDKGKRLAVDLV